MNQVLKLCCMLLAALFLAGCAKTQSNVDYDRSVNFGALKTYAWDPIKEAGTQNRGVDGKSIAQILTDAADRELAAKGFVRTDANPNLRARAYTQIQFKRADVPEADPSVIAQSRAEVAEDPIPPPPGGGSVPMQYAEGTIVLDMIDPATSKPIWRGSAVGVLKEKVDPAVRATRLDGEVRKMLVNFP